MKVNAAVASLGALILALLTAPQPRAEPLEHPVRGPMLVCFKYSTFQLAAGETITDMVGGFHGMRLTVRGPSGSYWVDESDNFPGVALKKRVLTQGATTVYRTKGPWRYAIYGPMAFWDGEEHLVLHLSGEALRGGKADQAIYSRFEVGDPSSAKCGAGFRSGFF